MVQHRGVRQPALGQFGNSGRNILRGPGINNLDLALFKNFTLAGTRKLQFRFESFNVFNHPQFSSVATNITAATSASSQARDPAASTSWG